MNNNISDSNIQRTKNIQEHSDYYLVTGEKNEKEVKNNDTGGENDIGEKKNISFEQKKSNREIDSNTVMQYIKETWNYAGLLAMNIRPKKEFILSPWFKSGSSGFIFGLPGSGKTWFAWKMAICISKGEDFGPWKCEKPWKTLYVDGEMPIESMQERLLLLDPKPSDNLILLSHEDLADKKNFILNLCKENQQEALLEVCIQNEIKVIFLDNLSCLCFGMRENEADDWEKVLGWLLRFRRAGIAVVIIHHANRDGNDMRGTSRREDAAFWAIKVARNNKGKKNEESTFFTTKFTKNRDDGRDKGHALDWAFITENNRTQVTCVPSDTKVLVYDAIRDGIDSCSDIAEYLGITKGAVSQFATRLVSDGLIKKQGNRYELA
jgi:hypothetical protein